MLIEGSNQGVSSFLAHLVASIQIEETP